MNSKSFQIQFLVALLSIFLLSSVFVDCRQAASNGASVQKPSDASRRKSSDASLDSLKLLWSSVQRLLTNALGPQAEVVFDEFGKQFSVIERVAEDLESLQDQQVINSVNEVLGSLFTEFESAVRTNEQHLVKGSYIPDTAFHNMLKSYESKVMKVIRSSKSLPQTLKTQLDTALPAIINNLSSVYSQIVQLSGMGLPAFIIIQYLPILLSMKKQVFVTTQTFEHVANLKKETYQAFNELVGEYLTPDKIQMLSMVISMLAQNMPRAHEDL